MILVTLKIRTLRIKPIANGLLESLPSPHQGLDSLVVLVGFGKFFVSSKWRIAHEPFNGINTGNMSSLQKRWHSLFDHVDFATRCLCPICSLLTTNGQTLIISRLRLDFNSALLNKCIQWNTDTSSLQHVSSSISRAIAIVDIP